MSAGGWKQWHKKAKCQYSCSRYQQGWQQSQFNDMQSIPINTCDDGYCWVIDDFFTCNGRWQLTSPGCGANVVPMSIIAGRGCAASTPTVPTTVAPGCTSADDRDGCRECWWQLFSWPGVCGWVVWETTILLDAGREGGRRVPALTQWPLPPLLLLPVLFSGWWLTPAFTDESSPALVPLMYTLPHSGLQGPCSVLDIPSHSPRPDLDARTSGRWSLSAIYTLPHWRLQAPCSVLDTTSHSPRAGLVIRTSGHWSIRLGDKGITLMSATWKKSISLDRQTYDMNIKVLFSH